MIGTDAMNAQGLGMTIGLTMMENLSAGVTDVRSIRTGVMKMTEERCVCCGRIIPEGSQVCSESVQNGLTGC